MGSVFTAVKVKEALTVAADSQKTVLRGGTTLAPLLHTEHG